jgi:hypothetical protein
MHRADDATPPWNTLHNSPDAVVSNELPDDRIRCEELMLDDRRLFQPGAMILIA